MNPNQFWLKLLNVHTHEWRVVRRLFWLQFFQGAGISFFFTAEFTRFLFKFPVHELPWVMIVSAFLLWLVGLIYTKLEHSINFKPFNIGIIVMMAGSMLLVRLGSVYFTQDWFYYLSLAWFYVLYLVNNLEFWGVAAQLFDIRQSKRLFGVISAGEIPAKFIGYTLAGIVVNYTGTNNLLVIGSFCMICSIPFFLSIAKTEEKVFSHPHGHPKVHHAAKSNIGTLVNNFFSNKIILRIALISLLASACMLIVNYGFYSKVKEAYHDDVTLATFIAMFTAGLSIAAMITKTIFIGRLTTNLGVRQSLFITPLSMVILVCTVLASGYFYSSEKSIFYLFGAISITIEVLRTSVNSPVLLTAMQPLPTHERLRAHNIVKGIMDPFAALFSGILLLLLFKFQKEVNLITLCYVLLILAVIWIIGIIRVNNEYVNMLVKTISSRFFSQEEFTLNDSETLNKIKEKISTGTYAEVLSVLQMVSTKQNPLSSDLLTRFLRHPSQEVKLEAIKLIGSKQINSLKEELNAMLFEGSPEPVKKEAIKTICRLAESTPVLNGYLHNPDAELRQAAIIGMLSNHRAAMKLTAEIELQHLLRSSTPDERKIAITILDEVKNEYDHPDHALLIESEDAVIRQEAINAIGTGALDESLEAVLRQIGRDEKIVYKALQKAGQKAIPHIGIALSEKTIGPAKRQQLISLSGKIGGYGSQQLLIGLLKSTPSASAEIIKALYRSKYAAEKELRPFLEELARAYLKYAVELLHMQKALPNKDLPEQLIFNAVQLELQEIRELLLGIFSFLYDREQIRKVRSGLDANQKESMANAMEIIEMTVRKDIGRYFNILYEDIPLDRKCDDLKFLNTDINYQQTNEVLGRILSEQPISYQDWTKACSMYITKKYGLAVDIRLFDKYLDADTLILQETARYACA